MVLSDAELRSRLGRVARAKAEHELSVEQFTHKCERVFESTLANHNTKIHVLSKVEK
jgi:hypothetical protein